MLKNTLPKIPYRKAPTRGESSIYFCAEKKKKKASRNQNGAINLSIRYLRSCHIDRRVLKVTSPRWLNQVPIRDAETQCDVAQIVERGAEFKTGIEVGQWNISAGDEVTIGKVRSAIYLEVVGPRARRPGAATGARASAS
jgi:hypothetical protein